MTERLPTPVKLSRLEDGPEIFYTLQGEGQSMGRPALFVRTSECNLKCVWCDTPNTWNWEGQPNVHSDDRQYRREDEQIELSTTDLVDRIIDTEVDRIVLTGGEPMMQQRQLTETLFLLKSINPDIFVEIETNGTITPRDFKIEDHRASMVELVDQWNVSPKLSSSKNDPRKAFKIDTLKRYNELEGSAFKFVIGNETDRDEAEQMIAMAELDERKIWIMPEGRTAEEIHDRMADLAEYCKERGFNLTTRLHIEIWGDKKGV